MTSMTFPILRKDQLRTKIVLGIADYGGLGLGVTVSGWLTQFVSLYAGIVGGITTIVVRAVVMHHIEQRIVKS